MWAKAEGGQCWQLAECWKLDKAVFVQPTTGRSWNHKPNKHFRLSEQHTDGCIWYDFLLVNKKRMLQSILKLLMLQDTTEYWLAYNQV